MLAKQGNSPVRWEKGLVVSRLTAVLTPSDRTLARTASHKVLSEIDFSENGMTYYGNYVIIHCKKSFKISILQALINFT